MHVKILSEGSFFEDTGGRGNGEGGLDVRALPPCCPPPQEPAKDKEDAGKEKAKTKRRVNQVTCSSRG